MIRIFAGVRCKRRYYYPPYAPNDPVPSRRRRFDINGATTPRRTAEINAGSAAKEECARRARQSKTAVRSLAQKEGVKGYSLFFAASPEDNARYPALEYLWRLGPELLPYDTMYLLLSNVVARLWELFAGEN